MPQRKRGFSLSKHKFSFHIHTYCTTRGKNKGNFSLFLFFLFLEIFDPTSLWPSPFLLAKRMNKKQWKCLCCPFFSISNSSFSFSFLSRQLRHLLLPSCQVLLTDRRLFFYEMLVVGVGSEGERERERGWWYTPIWKRARPPLSTFEMRSHGRYRGSQTYVENQGTSSIKKLKKVKACEGKNM